MSGAVYLLAEGVLDVTFLGKLLRVRWGAERVAEAEALDPLLGKWVNSFGWPTHSGGRSLIGRLSVPAPVFYRLPDGRFAVLRNAEGLTNLEKTLFVDTEFFSRESAVLHGIGVVLDRDDEPAEKRFEAFAGVMSKLNLPVPEALGRVREGAPRTGILSLPSPEQSGTIEDILLPLGDVAYPELCGAARGFAHTWHLKAGETPKVGKEWAEIRKPAGEKKAALSAAAAVLKPGKNFNATLEDHQWISSETINAPILAPCLSFLESLLNG